jgi:hypothetical protein
MGLGTITLLGMLCTPGQAPADVTPWNSPSMKIPIDYHPSKRAEIKELLLYVSPDQGQTWQHHAVGYPEKDGFFTFNAPADGIYWFNMVVVDKSGRREPADVYKSAPALKVLFDTKKPVVQIASAQRTGDDVTVVWKVIERNPDWSKFKLEYSTNGNTWTPVPTRPEADGSAQFKVAGGSPVTVRVALTDVAGLTGEATSPVAGTTVASKSVADPAVVGASAMNDLPLPSISGGTGPTVAGPAMPPVPGSDMPPVKAPATERAKDTRLPNEPKGTDTPPAPAFPPAPGTPGAPVVAADPPVAAPIGTAPKTEALNVSTNVLSSLPAPQVINVTSFKLAYEVEDKGASGVGKAEVWVTRDDGHTWAQWQTIDKPESTLLIDLARKGTKDVEGVYGIKVILQSGAGLAREAPKPGEAPDLRVDVDTTAPALLVFQPMPDAVHKDTLLLRWKAEDRNLAADPITLEWAEGPKGPWFPIAASDSIGSSTGVAKRLPNTGSYPWKVPANFQTHKVYLKVSARDVAGNVAEVIPVEPILVDLNKPAAVKLNIVGSGSH